MSTLKGDFIGFTFGGVHSSELGIMRVSDGSRYSQDLLPTLQHKVVTVPGGDGTYFFGSYHIQKPFELQIAFDELTEEGISKISELFGREEPQKLIFDETPYKYYMVNAVSSPTLNYVCFNEDSEYGAVTRRIYKGEGTISLVAYYPYARSVYKFLEDYKGKTDNMSEWYEASRLISVNDGTYDVFDTNHIYVYNPGIKETDFSLIIPLDLPLESGDKVKFDMSLNTKKLNIEIPNTAFIGLSQTNAIKINTFSETIEGGTYENGTFIPNGYLYNQYIKDGGFFKIPVSLEKIAINFNNMSKIGTPEISYEFLYY